MYKAISMNKNTAVEIAIKLEDAIEFSLCGLRVEPAMTAVILAVENVG
jgi:hypothetical protein